MHKKHKAALQIPMKTDRCVIPVGKAATCGSSKFSSVSALSICIYFGPFVPAVESSAAAQWKREEKKESGRGEVWKKREEQKKNSRRK